jgi:hypothetical protein
VRDELLPVLQEMDALDTEFIIQMVILAGDLSGAYDGFHSQNRNARSGIGNFCSRSFGFVLLVEILDKFRTEGVSGISQRLEKEGLKRGLARLILDCGLLLRDLCTDQCKGAPSDIAAVLDTQPVQKMLKALVPRLRVWVAEQLTGGARRGRWRDCVAEAKRAARAMDDIPRDEFMAIHHHFDVYHVEVSSAAVPEPRRSRSPDLDPAARPPSRSPPHGAPHGAPPWDRPPPLTKPTMDHPTPDCPRCRSR